MIYVLRLGYKIVGVFDTEEAANETVKRLNERVDYYYRLINNTDLLKSEVLSQLPPLLQVLIYGSDRLQVVPCPLNTLLDQLSWSAITNETVMVDTTQPIMI